MDSTNAQPWFKSRAIWGGVVALVAGVAGAFGLVIDLGTQGAIVDVLLAVGAAAGGAVAIYGRINATRKIG